MRNMKYLLAIVMVFSLLLAACSSGGQNNQNSAYPGAGNGNLNSNLNSNLNANTNLNSNANLNANKNANANTNLNANTNANTNTSGASGTRTPTAGALGTPLGTAVGGTPKATVAPATTTAPKATAMPAATTAPAATSGLVTGTAVAGTPIGGITGTPAASAGTGAAQYKNAVLLSSILGQTVMLDSGMATGTTGTNANSNANANSNKNANANTNTAVTNANANMNANANTNANTNAAVSGGKIGAVDSVIVNAANCQIEYVVVKADDGKLYPVPLAAFFVRGQTATLANPLTLYVTQKLWTGAPTWADDKLPDMSAAGWDKALTTYWVGYETPAAGGTTGNSNSNGNANTNSSTGTNANANANANANTNANTNAAAGMANAAKGAVRISSIKGLKAVDAQGNNLGDLNDAVVDLSHRDISWLVLGSGGFLGIGEKNIPIPCKMVSWQANKDDPTKPTAVLNVDQTKLKSAPVVSTWPTDFASGWDQAWLTYWGVTR